MKTKSKKSLDSFRAFHLNRDLFKHLKGEDDVIIEDVIDA